jgi:hypothetical protein
VTTKQPGPLIMTLTDSGVKTAPVTCPRRTTWHRGARRQAISKRYCGSNGGIHYPPPSTVPKKRLRALPSGRIAGSPFARIRIICRQAQMTKHISLLAKTVLTLLVVSGCSPQVSPRAEGTSVDNKLGASTGVTVFGDARLGVTFN